jgi:hypothetical protein
MRFRIVRLTRPGRFSDPEQRITGVYAYSVRTITTGEKETVSWPSVCL